ncbi:MAG: hypothetical protein KJ048_01820 [Dehalococcoidia bacterium]|nr:hypothetical protein [Dehalococcoidia bacterium]
MRYQDIVVGEDYGLRMRVSSKEPLHHVQVTQKVDRNKNAKVRHVDGQSEGMEKFFPFRNVAVPWNRRKQFLRNEESLRVIRELSADVDPVTKEAVQSVFGAAGEHSAFVHGDGHFSADAEAVKRLASRAGMPEALRELDSFAFVDDIGNAQLTFRAAYRPATELAKREPDTVRMEVEAREEELRAGGYGPGERWQHDWLRDQRRAFALMRQWAGFSSELDRLQKEVDRVRGLLYSAALELERAGRVREARTLQRALEGK